MVMYSLHFQVGNVHNYASLFLEATTCHPRESSNHVRKLLVLKPGEVDDVFRELFSQWNQTARFFLFVFDSPKKIAIRSILRISQLVQNTVDSGCEDCGWTVIS